MKTLPGNKLSKEDQAHVRRAYVHRFTREHRPQWAMEPRPDGSSYPVHFASDADRLANTEFRVTKGGKLDSRYRFCRSSPTWPDNPELRKS